MNTASSQTLYLLSLFKLKGVGPAALKKAALIPGFEGRPIEEVASFVPQIARSLEGGASWEEARDWAQKQGEAAQRHNAYILSAVDSAYPPLLAETKDDPFILYVQGELAEQGQRSVAVIGTREPTRHGELVANRITTHFGEAGWSIVSGLAIGCDGLAHQAALDCGAHTVAVMAHGLHMTAPAKHKKLAQDILARGGAVVSEYPFGQPVQSQQYVKRDRTQAGMALGVVMIQSDIKGGSLYASRAALEYGRWLAVPYPTDRDKDSREPKVQANLVIADAVPHERADLLRCTTSALERVIVLRNKEDYWRLAESSGVEPFATTPSAHRHGDDVAAPPWNAPDDFFDSSNTSPEEPASMQLEEAERLASGAEAAAVGDRATSKSAGSESAQRDRVPGDPRQAEELVDRIELPDSASGDATPPETEPRHQDAGAGADVVAGAQPTESQTVDAASAVPVDGAADVSPVEAIELAIAEKPRRVLLEVKLPKGEALGAAFGLWLPPKCGGKDFKKRLGNAVDDSGVREFYARHRHLQTRLTELQRKLLAAKLPLKHDQVLAFRLLSEEAVLQISKVVSGSAAIDALSRAERRRVEEEDWIEQGATERQPSHSEDGPTSELRRGLIEDVSALLMANLQSFVINDGGLASIENSGDAETHQLSLQLLIEKLNSVLKSVF